MSTTALLVRWMGGYMDVVQPGADVREEGFLKVGAAHTPEEATALALAALAHEAERNEKITVAVHGAFAAVVGDTLTAPDSDGTASTWRVVGINYTHDADGVVTRVPLLELVP